jgi:YHS domain-containing protein
MKKYLISKGLIFAVCFGVGATLVFSVGCQPSADSAAKSDTKNLETTTTKEGSTSKTSGSDSPNSHEHESGSHGGQVLSLGRDSYHVEVVETKGATSAERLVRLYLLGSDESRIEEIEAVSLQAYLKGDGDSEAVIEKVDAEPQPGDSPGKTSVMVMKIPEKFADKTLAITIPNIRFGTERFRLAFKLESDQHEQEAMHGVIASKEASAEDEELYLTPGGLYTDEDIKANGGVTAAQKFRGIKATHDVKPKSGDMLCPISMTKANAEFTWVIGGKPYQFCCPPCVDEFLALAKKSPEKVNAPETYVKP